MKKFISFFVLTIFYTCLLTSITCAQTEIDTTVDLDVLTIPNSPAFNLLGVSPNEVDKPTTPTDFALSIANGTNNLSQLPANYSIEFLPISFFPKHKLSYEKFTNNPEGTEEISPLHKLRNNFAQTFIISSGFSTDETIDTTSPDYIKTRNGTGFKFSLIRGKIDTAFEDYKESIQEIRQTLNLVHNANITFMDSIKESDPVYSVLKERKDQIQAQIVAGNSALVSEGKIIGKELEKREDELKQELYKNKTAEAAMLKKQIENIKFKRYGPLLDFAGGMVLGFRNNDFQNSIVQQYAFWLNGGYSCKQNFSILGLIRYSTAIDGGIDDSGKKEDVSIWDLGGKVEFKTKDEKFSLSGELIGRIYSDTTISRYSFNASYQVGKNQALTFSIGKAFNGTAQTGGNLIAALNYIKTFGSKRTLVPQ